MKERIQRWLSDLWRRICWNAWNYARNRAVRNAHWLPGEAKEAESDDSPELRRIKAHEARNVLENKHFREAWDALNAGLEARALSCDVYGDKGQAEAARILAAKQLLHGLRREFLRKMDDGYMAEIELDELARKRRLQRFER
jgi:hypothetical protein